MNFKVVYEIEVDAKDQVEAALIVEQILKTPVERPSVIVIDDKGKSVLIDLEQEEKIENIPNDSLKFVCPSCQSDRLECCEDGAYASEVVHIGEDGDFDYGMINADGMVDRFQCLDCGFVLKDSEGENITDVMEIVEWIKNRE